jgi:hypothetical protein
MENQIATGQSWSRGRPQIDLESSLGRSTYRSSGQRLLNGYVTRCDCCFHEMDGEFSRGFKRGRGGGD